MPKNGWLEDSSFKQAGRRWLMHAICSGVRHLNAKPLGTGRSLRVPGRRSVTIVHEFKSFLARQDQETPGQEMRIEYVLCPHGPSEKSKFAVWACVPLDEQKEYVAHPYSTPAE